MSENEQKYQPTSDDISNAESLMNKYERLLSSERENLDQEGMMHEKRIRHDGHSRKLNIFYHINNYERIGKILSEDIEGVSQHGMWNNPNHYYPLIIESICRNPSISETYLIELFNKSNDIQEFVLALIKDKPFDGLKVAEIGGTIGALILEKLGATITIKDAGMERGEDFPERLEDLINLSNYGTSLPEKYDIVLTNQVFQLSSSISSTNSKHYVIDKGRQTGIDTFMVAHKYAFTEMLCIIHNILAENGVFIEQGHGEIKQLLADQYSQDKVIELGQIGFKQIEKYEGFWESQKRGGEGRGQSFGTISVFIKQPSECSQLYIDPHIIFKEHTSIVKQDNRWNIR